MAFNLSAESTVAAKQEEGIDVPLVSPSGESTGAMIRLAGPDSRRANEAVHAAWRHVIEARGGDPKADATDEEKRQAGARYLAGCVISWEGVTADGETPMDCTIDNVLTVFAKVPWVQRLLDYKFGSRANFTQG